MYLCIKRYFSRHTILFLSPTTYHVTHSQDKIDFPIQDIHILNGTLLPSGGNIDLHSTNGTFPNTQIHFGPAQNTTK
jgi:hypothetical protein